MRPPLLGAFLVEQVSDAIDDKADDNCRIGSVEHHP